MEVVCSACSFAQPTATLLVPPSLLLEPFLFPLPEACRLTGRPRSSNLLWFKESRLSGEGRALGSSSGPPPKGRDNSASPPIPPHPPPCSVQRHRGQVSSFPPTAPCLFFFFLLFHLGGNPVSDTVRAYVTESPRPVCQSGPCILFWHLDPPNEVPT